MMPIFEKIILLKSVPLFAGLSGEDLFPVAEIAQETEVPHGTTLFKQGDIGHYLYVVVRGRVAIIKEAKTIAERGPKQCFGEMAILDEGPRSATAVTQEDTELLRISGESFSELLDQHTELARGIIRVLLSYLRTPGREGSTVSDPSSELLPT